MNQIEVGDMTIAEVCIAIEKHVAEAVMHMMTAQGLLDVTTERGLDIWPEIVRSSDGDTGHRTLFCPPLFRATTELWHCPESGLGPLGRPVT